MEGVKLWPKDTPGLPGVIDREEWVKTDSCKMIGGKIRIIFLSERNEADTLHFPANLINFLGTRA